MPAAIPPPGLQIERTQLAWERTALSLLAVAGVLLFHPAAPLIHGRLILGLAAIALALAVFRFSRIRGRVATSATPTGTEVVAAPDRQIRMIGAYTVALAALIALSALLGR